MKFPKPFVSRKVAVLGENRDLKRKIAESLVLKGFADWVIYMVSIQMRPLWKFDPSGSQSGNYALKRYIPEEMPADEIPGVYFQPPVHA